MIILLIHQKGGVGKSTMSLNIAYELKKHYSDISILDLDSQHSSVLFNKLRSKKELPTIDCKTQIEVNLKSFLATYINNKDNLLIIDSGGYDSDINRLALLKADIIITPVGISQIEIFGLQKFVKILVHASKVAKKKITTNVLINNVDSRSQRRIEALKKHIREKSSFLNIFDTVIYARADYKFSYSEGLAVSEYNSRGKACIEMAKLSSEINSLINNRFFTSK